MNNQPSKSITQIRSVIVLKRRLKAMQVHQIRKHNLQQKNFFHYRRFSGLQKRRNNSDDIFFKDLSACSSVSRRLSSEDEECDNGHRPLELEMEEIESKVDEIEELKLKMKSRDLIISCMEETLQNDIRNMQDILVEFERKAQL